MNIHLFNKARSMSLAKVDSESLLFQCIDLEHELPLLTGLDNELNIYVWCIQCEFRRYIGLNTYDRLLKKEGLK